MTYIIQRKSSNGYRCGCCMSTWLEDELVCPDEESVKKAIREVFNDEGGEFSELIGLEAWENTPERAKVASVRKHWPSTRGERYSKTEFIGYYRGHHLMSILEKPEMCLA